MRGLLVVIAVAGCGGSVPGALAPSDAGTADAGEFIALAGDFAGYRTWTRFDLDGGGQYPRAVFVKDLPPSGARLFPVGTMIVKELVSPGSPGGLEVDAMVKRGGSFNADGAPGWEFFELAQDGGAEVGITWRGTGTAAAPTEYGGGGATCVGCHAGAQANDFVQTPALRLQ